MELPLAVAIGLLFAGGIYSILRPNLIRMVIGFGLLSNAVNLLMIVCGGFSLRNAAPFVSDPNAVAGLMDPIPPDIVLTAIVISITAMIRAFLFMSTSSHEGRSTRPHKYWAYRSAVFSQSGLPSHNRNSALALPSNILLFSDAGMSICSIDSIVLLTL